MSNIAKIIFFFIITRFLLIFCLIPIIHAAFIRFNMQIDESQSISEIWMEYLTPWDGKHFREIYLNGYQFERQHVFFPLNKIIIDFISDMTSGISKILIGLILSNLFSLGSCILLYILSVQCFGSTKFALYSTLFFCLNLCTRFYISLYTESLYTFLSLLGMTLIQSTIKRDPVNDVGFFQILGASIIFIINVACRSNSCLLSLIPGYYILIKCYRSLNTSSGSLILWFSFGHFTLCCFLYCFYYLVNQYPYQLYCKDENPSEWCHQAFPNLYDHIQKVYWNTGFLRQLDRGLHSSYFATLPVNFFNIWLICLVYNNLKAYINLSKSHNPSSSTYTAIKSFLDDEISFRRPNKVEFCQIFFLPIILHYILLIIFINLFANLEILMRVVSTHPVYHWGYVYLLAKKQKSAFEKVVGGLLVVHHAVFMVFEFTAFPLNVGTP
ncbi:unnamed protein product [Moneuplotes crassus]|uniref:GPI mannosyltransferase 2 n=1 Tax=Euplotes crassus TaxID=5936 RepID=A0AAD1UI14_EUPCR|nr:unnamed protein product [Moneuplotes crassus]